MAIVYGCYMDYGGNSAPPCMAIYLESEQEETLMMGVSGRG